jgi:hypothetical protein
MGHHFCAATHADVLLCILIFPTAQNITSNLTFSFSPLSKYYTNKSTKQTKGKGKEKKNIIVKRVDLELIWDCV